MDFAAHIQQHPALSPKGLMGQPGYPLPVLADPLTVAVDQEGVALLATYGITVYGGPGTGNRVVLDRAMKPINIRIGFGGRQDNVVVLEAIHQMAGQIGFQGDGNLAVVGRGWYSLKLDFVDSRSAFYVGPHSSVGDAYVWVQGDERSIILGEDCMLAWGVGLRTGDAHGVIDVERRAIANGPQDLLIGPHVWLAQDVLVFKGVEIGAGTVVGARAVVAKSLPGQCAASGVPAKVLRRGTTWCRPAAPPQGEIDALLARPYLAQP